MATAQSGRARNRSVAARAQRPVDRRPAAGWGSCNRTWSIVRTGGASLLPTAGASSRAMAPCPAERPLEHESRGSKPTGAVRGQPSPVPAGRDHLMALNKREIRAGPAVFESVSPPAENESLHSWLAAQAHE